MNDLAKYKPHLPVSQSWQLEKQKRQMEYVARLTIEAINEQSNLYSYIVYNVLQTMDNVTAMKMAFSVREMSPEAEAMLQKLTANYLLAMEQIPTEAWNRVLKSLQSAQAEPDDGGYLGFVIEQIVKHLKRGGAKQR